MVELFPGYYPFTRKQLKSFSKDATIVFGASVLLDLYRINYWKVFLDIVERNNLQERLWLPYDTAWIYHNRLPQVIKSQLEEVKTAAKYLEQFKSKVDNPYGHPFISKDLIEQYNQFVIAVSESLNQDARYLIENLRHSELKSKLSNLFNDKVGIPYDESKMAQLYNEAKRLNMANKCPCLTISSSLDIRFQSNRYIIWKQIQQHAKETGKPVLLVLNRITPNWFDIYNDETILPQHELINEFKSGTGVDIHITTAYDFIKHFSGNHPNKAELLHQLHNKPTLGNLQQIQISNMDNQTNLTNG